MSCYQPLLSNFQEDKRKSAVTCFNVLLTIFGFFLFFLWFSKYQFKHSDHLVLEPATEFIPKSAYDPYHEISPEFTETTTGAAPKNITAATLFPAKTTTFDTSVSLPKCQKRIVGYYNGWDNRKLSENQLRKVSHLVFAFAKMSKNGKVDFENEEKKELFLEMKRKAKDVNSGVKVMISIGGLYNSEHFSKTLANFKRRGALIDSIVSFLQDNQFDGVDIFWKWPGLQDKANYVFFLRELRHALQKTRNPFILSIVTPSVGFELMDGFHLNGILKYVDFINVETDQQSGRPGPYTSTPSPLFSLIGKYEEYNIDWTMRHLSCVSRKPGQLNMGVPFYGRFWKRVQDAVEKRDEMWRTVEASSEGHVASGTVFWRNIEREGWDKERSSWHDESKTPYIWDKENRMFLGFENEKSLAEKMKYAVEKNLGGLTIWTMEMDDDVESLLEAVTSSCLKSEVESNGEAEEGSGEEEDKNEVNYKCEN
ncbi:unnamed protein product [Caenorhabditis nigoni]